MKRLTYLITFLIHSTLAIPALDIWCVNRSTDTAWVSLAVPEGDRWDARPFQPVAPGDSCLLVEDLYLLELAWYCRFANEQGTDLQYDGADAERYRMTPPFTHRVRTLADRNGHNVRSWVYYTPLTFGPEDTVAVIRLERSDCRGRCGHGTGTRFGYLEELHCTWLDSLPEGEGWLISGDTTYTGAWVAGVMDGWFVIKAADGYLEEGMYVDGIRQGDFSFTMPNGDRYQYNFLNGELHGLQTEVVRRVDGYGRERLKKWFEHGIPVVGPPRPEESAIAH